jgi:hypothetical protein
MDAPFSLQDGYYISDHGHIVEVKIGQKTIKLSNVPTNEEIIFNHYTNGYWFAPEISLKVIFEGFELAMDKQDPSCTVLYKWLKYLQY